MISAPTIIPPKSAAASGSLSPVEITTGPESGIGAGGGVGGVLTHLDLFSGIGGFALAAEEIGFRTIGFCELAEYPAKVLKHHWPSVPNHGDIRNIKGIKADLVTGGFPCQPFTTLGQRRGKADDRWLWPEMCRVIADAEPAWIVGENVAGFIQVGLETVLSDLAGLGFEAWPVVIPACAIGAHHRRDRVWILAWNPDRAAVVAGKTLSDIDADSIRGARRPTMPVLHRAANGIPAKLDRLHGLGNAIVPQVAREILSALASTFLVGRAASPLQIGAWTR